jgi:hypothetical protein
MMRAYSDVLIADYTYKTNRYNMPLLHFLGVTPINTSFSAGFAFLLGEEQSDYDFAIKCFKTQVLGDLATDDDAVTLEVVITDNETALKNSLSNLLPGIPQLLCY